MLGLVELWNLLRVAGAVDSVRGQKGSPLPAEVTLNTSLGLALLSSCPDERNVGLRVPYSSPFVYDNQCPRDEAFQMSRPQIYWMVWMSSL